MAEYRGVNNVARQIVKEYRGVANVARQVTKAYRGVANVARQYIGNGFWVQFRKPSSYANVTVDSEYAGVDGNTIRLSFNNAKINSGGSHFMCRMYIYPDESYWDKTLSFDYTLSGYSASNHIWQLQFKNENDYDLREKNLSHNTDGRSISFVIPTNTYRIDIGVWSNVSGKDGEMIITNMYIRDEQII